MNVDFALLTSLIAKLIFLGIIFQQSKSLKILRDENKKLLVNNDELLALASEKIKVLGDIKTVKYLRQEKGLSMIDAKHLVDAVKDGAN